MIGKASPLSYTSLALISSAQVEKTAIYIVSSCSIYNLFTSFQLEKKNPFENKTIHITWKQWNYGWNLLLHGIMDKQELKSHHK